MAAEEAAALKLLLCRGPARGTSVEKVELLVGSCGDVEFPFAVGAVLLLLGELAILTVVFLIAVRLSSGKCQLGESKFR